MPTASQAATVSAVAGVPEQDVVPPLSCVARPVPIDLVATLPPARVCKEAWGLLRAVQKESGRYTGVWTGLDSLPSELDCGTLHDVVNAAADAYAALPDAISNLVPLRAALYEHAFARLPSPGGQELEKAVAPLQCAPAVEGVALPAKARGTQRALTNARKRGRGSRPGSSAAEAPRYEPPKEEVTISSLLSSPTAKKDATKLTTAVARLVQRVEEMDDESGSALLVANETESLIRLCVGSRGPKFHSYSAATVMVVTELGLHMGRTGSEGAVRAASLCLLDFVALLLRNYGSCLPEVRALPELWFTRVVAPLCYLLPAFQWPSSILSSVAQLIHHMALPTSDDEGATAAESTGFATNETSAGGTSKPTSELIRFDEHIQLDSRSMDDAKQLRPWNVAIRFSYATKVSVMVHTAIRCEGTRLCLIPSPQPDTEQCDQRVGVDLSSPASFSEQGECIVALTPRTAHVMQHPGTVFFQCVPTPFTHLEASIQATVTLDLDTSWSGEVRGARSRASIIFAEKLLLNHAAADKPISTLLASAFAGGRRDYSSASVAVPGDDATSAEALTFARIHGCRVVDVPRLRPLLLVTRHLLAGDPSSAGLSQAAVGRAVRQLDRLSRIDPTQAMGLATAFRGIVQPPATAMSFHSALEMAVELLLSNIKTSADIVDLLDSRCDIARSVVDGLALLQSEASRLPLAQLHNISKVCRLWLCSEPTHYLLRVKGCGATLERQVQSALHNLWSLLFQSLTVAMRHMTAAVTASRPHRFVTHEAKFGAHALLTMSMLTAPLNVEDLEYVAHSMIADQLFGVVPRFSDFSRSSSFRIEDESEQSMSSLLQQLVTLGPTIRTLSADRKLPTPGAKGAAAVQRGLSRVLSRADVNPFAGGAHLAVASPVANPAISFLHAQRIPDGGWSVSTARCKWQVSKEPVFDVDTASEALPQFLEVTLKSSHENRSNLAVVLVDAANNQNGSTLQKSMPPDDGSTASIFIFADGALSYLDANRSFVSTKWIALEEDHKLGMGFVFDARCQRWQLLLYMDEVQVARLPVFATTMYLGIGAHERSPSKATVEVSFVSGADRHWSAACASALGKGVMPTLHEVSLFASHTFYLLMATCSAIVLPMEQPGDPRREATVALVPPGTPTHSGNPLPSRSCAFTLSSLVQRGKDLLCTNYSALLSVLSDLPVDVDTAAGRVKVRAAQLVYHHLLKYLLSALQLVCRTVGYDQESFDVIAQTAGCQRCSPSLHVHALRVLASVLDESPQVSQRIQPPHALWARCLELGEVMMASEYVPLFSEGTVGPKLTTEEGGRGVTAAAVHRSSDPKNAAYATPPIGFGPSGENRCRSAVATVPSTTSFTIRVSRRSRPSGTLGRYYFVGVIGYRPNSANTIFSDYTRNMGDRCFLLPDFASEGPGHMLRAELERHRRNWFTSDSGGDAVVFGSGDLITVTVDRKRRSVAFRRNGLPLGALYQDIAADITELFPMVCLYNGDASATLQFRPNEVGIRARALSRHVLRAWPDTFAPLLLRMLEDRNPLALQILQSDGNDFAFMQRSALQLAGQPSAKRAGRFLLVQIHPNEWMEVVDAEGRHRLVPADSLIPDFNSPAVFWLTPESSCGPAGNAVAWRQLVVKQLVEMVTASVIEDGEGSICVLAPRATLRALRLLCQLPDGGLSLLDANAGRALLDIIRTLSCLDESDGAASPVEGGGPDAHASETATGAVWGAPNVAEVAVQSAWTELDAVDEHQIVFPSSTHAPMTTVTPNDAVGAIPHAVANGAAAPQFPACPQCGEVWGSPACHHIAPRTLCEVYDVALRRAGVRSPYCGWRGQWSGGGTQIDLVAESDLARSLRSVGKEAITGRGEDGRGRFTVHGVVIDGHRILAKLSYMCYGGDNSEPPEPEEELQEWVCEACTLINPVSVSRCAACNSGRPGSCWSCPGCTYAFNSVEHTQCLMCGSRRVVEQPRPGQDAQHSCRCVDCHSVKTFNGNFSSFSSYQDCQQCRRRTAWIPEESFTATLSAALTTAGDVLDSAVQLNSDIQFLSLTSHSYTLSVLQDLVRTEGGSVARSVVQTTLAPVATVPLRSTMEAMARAKPDTARDSSSQLRLPPGFSGAEHEAILHLLGARFGMALSPVLVPAAGSGSPSSPSSPPSTAVDASQRAVRTAVQVLASRALCAWLPALVSEKSWLLPSEATAYLASIRTCSAQWIESWANGFDSQTARALIDSLLERLHVGSVPASSACALVAPILALLELADCGADFQCPQRLALLVSGVARSGSVATKEVRELAMGALLRIFEWLSGRGLTANVSSVQKLLSQQPSLSSQQRLTIFAALHGVDTGRRQAEVSAAAWVAKAMSCLLATPCKPLSRFFDVFRPEHSPHLVVLPDTKLSDAGDLVVGQVRGSVPVHPNRGGKFYFEVVLPPNFSDRSKVIVAGWGSRLHEIQGSSQHVGSDFHSWGYNCRNKVKLLTSEHEVPVARFTTSGDVVGAMLNLDAKQMCWTINGERLQWLDIPLQGDGEPIFPFVSASVDPHAVLVRLSDTQYLPEGYTDFPTLIDDEDLLTVSTVAPQSFNFYRELTGLVNEVHGSGVTMEALRSDPVSGFALAAPLLPQFPLLAEAVRRHGGRDLGTADGCRKGCDSEIAASLAEQLMPYVQHLQALSAMAAIVAKRSDLVKDSPFLWKLYQSAKELLFFSARWALVDVHLNRRLNRSGDRRAPSVVIDRAAADSAVTAAKRFGSDCTQFPPEVNSALLSQTVTGQLFRALHARDVYTQLNMFTVQIRDSITEDAGGVTRSMISLMCDELMWRYDAETNQRAQPAVPLFALAEHSTYFNLVPNMKWLASLTADLESTALQLYEWLGKLFGNAVLAGTLLYALDFPRIVWKFVVNEDCSIEEFFLDCSDSARGPLSDDSFLLSDEELFSAIPAAKDYCSGQSVEAAVSLHPSESSDILHGASLADVPMTNSGRDELVEGHISTSSTFARGPSSAFGLDEAPPAENPQLRKIVKRRRSAAVSGLLHQYDKALLRIRQGFQSVVPSAAVEQMRWDDVRQRVCGTDAATVADLLASMDLTSLSEPMQTLLTEAVRRMSATVRSSLLLFATGQRRLPVPEKIRVTCGDDPAELPTSHTCSPISMKLQPYRTVEELLEKLGLSLAHVYEFGFV